MNKFGDRGLDILFLDQYEGGYILVLLKVDGKVLRDEMVGYFDDALPAVFLAEFGVEIQLLGVKNSIFLLRVVRAVLIYSLSQQAEQEHNLSNQVLLQMLAEQKDELGKYLVARSGVQIVFALLLIELPIVLVHDFKLVEKRLPIFLVRENRIFWEDVLDLF